MHRYIPLLLLAFAALLAACHQQRPAGSGFTDARWERIDSLGRQGLFASALEETEALLTEAQRSGAWRTEFRATMQRGLFQRLTGTEAEEVIATLEEQWEQETRTPMRQLLASVLAEAYWQHYMDHRWLVLDRPDGGAPHGNPSTWGQQQYMRKVMALQRAALEPFDSLRHIPAGTLGELLATAPGDDAAAAAWQEQAMLRRPTVFDLLAHRALDIYTQAEPRITPPAQRFRPGEAHAFALWEEFALKDLTHPDSSAFDLQAMRVFQQLARLRLRDDDPTAFVDLDLKRLAWVYGRSTLPERDSLYMGALRQWRTRCAAYPVWAEVTHAMATWHATQAERHDRFHDDGPYKWLNRSAAALCRAGLAHAPGTPVARDLIALLKRLEQPVVVLRSEEAMLPERESLVLVEHANAPALWLRVFPAEHRLGQDQGHDEQALKALLQRKPLHAWRMDLPDAGDMHRHMVEVPVPALPPGHYTLVASDHADFDPGRNTMAQVSFWSTRLGHAERRLADGRSQVLVLDRLDGRPVEGVEVELHLGEYTQGGARYTREATARTDAAGLVHFSGPERGGMSALVLRHGEDRCQTGTGFMPRLRQSPPLEVPRTFLFTDRAIYRPGQTLHFKGIATVRRGLAVEVRSGHATRVLLHDANGRMVDSMHVTTDAYGAFHGVFRVPGGLTGHMRLAEEHGTRSFLVEEYKRPTFRVDLAAPALPSALGQETTLAGTAEAYTGQAIDGAQVRWRVYRSAHRPWWAMHGRGGMPPMGRETEVASGSTTTDAQGGFALAFTAAAPDEGTWDRDAVYHFRVEADVTDISGETRSATHTMVLGHRSLGIHIGADAALDRSTTDSLMVQVRDLNGSLVEQAVRVRITKLGPPFDAATGPPRARLWDRPDRSLMDRSTHVQRFPMDVYRDEDDPATWPVEETVLSHERWMARGAALHLPGVKQWDVGTYRIAVATKVQGEDSVHATRHFTVYDPRVLLSGTVGEAFSVREERTTVEPGGKAVVLIGTALPELRVLMEVERPNINGTSGTIALQRRFLLKREQQRVEIPVLEDDRGGFTIHLIAAERGRIHQQQVQVHVPWTNKELRMEWATFRDRLLPGQREEWRLRISGPKGERVAAQLMAGLYDASLEAFAPHDMDMVLRTPNRPALGWMRNAPFALRWGRPASRSPIALVEEYRPYPWLDTQGFLERWWVMYAARSTRMDNAMQGMMDGGEALEMAGDADDTAAPFATDAPVAAVRSDMRETAFFLPDLRTGPNGTVVLRFTMPEGLTRWNFFALAHTADLQVGRLLAEAVTSKPMMVVPELPRFLRAGDRITLSARVGVLQDLRVEGLARLELFDPATGRGIDAAFGHRALPLTFLAAPGERALLAWDITVPEGLHEVGVRITAEAGSRPGPMGAAALAGGFSDGEAHVLPVLTDKVLVTESLPMTVTGPGTHEFALEKLAALPANTGLQQLGLSLEYTPAPLWHAVKALPTLMEFPHDCAEQVFGRYTANRLAAHVMQRDAGVERVVERWQAVRDSVYGTEGPAQEGGVLVEESPWVAQVAARREREARLGLLFDRERVATEEQRSLQRLRDMQRGDGAWPWFSGMPASRLVTQHIVAGIGHLQATGAAELRSQGEVTAMLQRALAWMDDEAARVHRERMTQADGKGADPYRPGHADVQYLYARSFHQERPLPAGARAAAEAMRNALRGQWLSYGLQEQAMIALAMHRMGERDTPVAILRSLKERATVSATLGMYWKGFAPGLDWGTFPVETHALLIEAFIEVGQDVDAVAALRTHLLGMKRSTDWGNTKATAAAVHAMLLGTGPLPEQPAAPRITVGGVPVVATAQEAGTGHFTHTWPGKAVVPAMGRVSVEGPAEGQAWGALHWRYLERADAVTRPDGPIQLQREVLVEQHEGGQVHWVPLGQAPPPRQGDRIRVRLTLHTDRWLDHVHLKDMRAAGLEPVDALSGYRHQGGLGHYLSIRDAAMHFFVDRVPPGSHAMEYSLRVVHAGEMSAGIATALCMYAPEFAAHSEGLRVRTEVR